LTIRLRALFKRTTVERDIDDELAFHCERHVESHIANGLSPEQAVRRARLEFGGIDQSKEACRDALGVSPLALLRRD
jgi:hypothetical protein